MKEKKKKHIVLWILLGILLTGLAIAAFFVIRIITRPETLFETSQVISTPQPEQSAMIPAYPIPTKEIVLSTDQPSDDTEIVIAGIATLEATIEPKPTEEPTPKPVIDTSGVLNIMLMGIDAHESGRTSSGTMPHTDANMIIAVNFNKQVVDLISIPRDAITTAPGYQGFYKFNGVFNVGGGMDDIKAGLEETCRAAEMWLGGVSVPYYYAVDFQAVIDIVDAIGGIDYEVDQFFTSNYKNKPYYKGWHHLDGDAVMGYLRVRKAADGLDSSRTARQRKMMVAIFNKLKTEGKLSMIPGLINAVNSGIYTNTTLAQTTALANYAMNLDGNNIRSRAFNGSSRIRYDWLFCYIDQQNRIDIIKDVYGIDAEPMGVDTELFEDWFHETGLDVMKSIRQAEKVLTHVQEQKEQGNVLSEDDITVYAECYLAYYELDEEYKKVSKAVQELGCSSFSKEELSIKKNELNVAFPELIQRVKVSTEKLATASAYKKRLKWNVYKAGWFADQDINEIYVDFR